MFNDKYGLTRAVLEGRKTQTRRLILSKTIEKAEQYRVDYFNDTLDNIPLEDILIDANQLMGVPSLSSYQVGEVDPKKITVQELGLYMSGAKRDKKGGNE